MDRSISGTWTLSSVRRFLRSSRAGRDTTRWTAVAVLSLVLCAATGALVWFGFVTTREWSRGTSLLLERRQAEALSLIGAALTRDLRGAWTRVLVPFNGIIVEEDPPLAMMQLTSRAFARFPYAESLLVWNRQAAERECHAFIAPLGSRPGSKASGNGERSRRPHAEPSHCSRVDELQRCREVRAFAVLEVTIDGVPNHVVATSASRPALPARLRGIYRNLQWNPSGIFRPLWSRCTDWGVRDYFRLG